MFLGVSGGDGLPYSHNNILQVLYLLFQSKNDVDNENSKGYPGLEISIIRSVCG